MAITIADGRGALWQWDTGRRVKITDGDGVKQIHYQNRCFGRSVDVDVGTDGTAIIPDELLQDCHTLTVYAYVTDDTGAYTMVQQDFAVHKRGKPAGYVYTPTDQMTLQTIQRQIGDLADLTTEAKDTLVAAINEAARMSGSESVGLRVADGYIQYSTDGGNTWTNLIAMAELKGANGAPGKDGVMPDIKIGTVTTLPAGSEATASMGGTAAQPTLNLGIPKGANGDNANVTKDAIVGALRFTPIGADDVPVKSVNGQTGEVKGTFYVTVTQGNGNSATADKTAAEVYAAYVAGYAVYALAKFSYGGGPFVLPLAAAASDSEIVVLGFAAMGSTDPTEKPLYLSVLCYGGVWSAWCGTLARSEDIPAIPTALKNPNALTIKIGSTTVTYDGSAAKTVEIADGSEVSY